MIVNEISQNPYIEIPYAKSPYRVYFAQNPSKNYADTFEKQKAPYGVESSVEDFSFELAEMMEQKKCDKDNLKKLVRKYVPRTKLKEDRVLLFVNNASAMYRYHHTVSSNNKMHCPKKIIVVDLSKQEEKPNVFFNDLVHEMIHNLQTNKEKKVMNKIYKDFFEETVKTHSAYLNLSKNATRHGEEIISEYYNKKLGVIKFIERKNYSAKKWEYIDKFTGPESRADAAQVYDLNVLTILAQEEEAYNVADRMEAKFFGTKINQRKTARRQRMFNDLKEIIFDDLKNLGMGDEKIKEYKDLICG